MEWKNYKHRELKNTIVTENDEGGLYGKTY